MGRKTHDDFRKELELAEEKISIGSRWFHYKNPDQFYIIKNLVIIEATEEVGVVYEAQYGGRIKFLRALSNFLDIVEKDGLKLTRFSKS